MDVKTSNETLRRTYPRERFSGWGTEPLEEAWGLGGADDPRAPDLPCRVEACAR